MFDFVRRSLLCQLLSVYILFVLLVLIGGMGVSAIIEQQLRKDAQVSDQALAQDIASDTSFQLLGVEKALTGLSDLVLHANSPATIATIFQTFEAARSDVDHLYWLDPFGILHISCPHLPVKCQIGLEEMVVQFSPPDVVQRALLSQDPVFEVGIAAKTSKTAGVIIAESVRGQSGELLGIVAASISLAELSKPLEAVVAEQRNLGRQLVLSIIDDQGRLIATPDSKHILWTVLDELPGADQALQGHLNSREGISPDGREWLFSSVPISGARWAVVVQRPTEEALAIIGQLHLWLLTIALFFTIGGLLFWLLLLVRVIRPLHTLASEYQALPNVERLMPISVTRNDEVGDLARSLVRLERDGLRKLGELRTLLETSNAVVGSLEPRAVVRKIIAEVRRLVDVQAAAVLLPDEQGQLRVLVSDGHSDQYNHLLSLSPENRTSAPVMALYEGRPVQRLLSSDQQALSYAEGFRSVLAIPITSRHAGSVVLLVHRIEPHPFKQQEIDLLLTFANYATLAREHAVLYERSDERLREIAHENEFLYQQASEEKHKLEAIMGSMSDGLILMGMDKIVLYANHGASTITELVSERYVGLPIDTFYAALCLATPDPEQCMQAFEQAAYRESPELEIRHSPRHRIIHLRLFDVVDELHQPIGRGLLLRDVTRERELEEFKTTLLAAVGHEVRTPLAVIKGYASTLLQEDVCWSHTDQQHFLQTIESEADRLTQLVRNLLDLSRQEAGLLLLNREPTRIQDLIARTIERVSLPHIVISSEIPDDLPPVNIDSARIEVVLHNLITNALIYGEGNVYIVAKREIDAIVVSVADKGPGIPDDELAHIFERFYRAGYGRQHHSGGTGLGLSICKAFVEAHGCAIWAENTIEGTTFSFLLPLVPPLEIQHGMPIEVERRYV